MAAQKKTQQKPASTPAGSRLTKKQYQDTHADVMKTVEGLEADLSLDLTELKKKLNCFCHNPHTA